MDMDVQIMASGLRFPEGPVALADGSVLVVEIAAGTLSRVDSNGGVTVVAECGGGPNGAAIGPDGAVYICNNGGQQFVRTGDRLMNSLVNQNEDYVGGSIQRVDLDTGEVRTLYTECEGRSLSAPTTSSSTRRRYLVHRQWEEP